MILNDLGYKLENVEYNKYYEIIPRNKEEYFVVRVETNGDTYFLALLEGNKSKTFTNYNDLVDFLKEEYNMCAAKIEDLGYVNTFEQTVWNYNNGLIQISETRHPDERLDDYPYMISELFKVNEGYGGQTYQFETLEELSDFIHKNY